jgi:hypothetical protein
MKARTESVPEADTTAPKSQPNFRLDKHLAAYVTAATAAGVAMMAAASPAAAEVVYTRAHVNIGPVSTYRLDVNHDGVADFNIAWCGPTCVSGHSSVLFVAPQVAGDQVIAEGQEAAALAARAPIGPGQNFTTGYFYGGLQMAVDGGYSGHSWFFGSWANATNKYLGLKFLIDGQVHYGWARLTVARGGDALLTGYAYETTPNKGIPAGLESGIDTETLDVPTAPSHPALQSATLGMLARGADALTLWRHEN